MDTRAKHVISGLYIPHRERLLSAFTHPSPLKQQVIESDIDPLSIKQLDPQDVQVLHLLTENRTGKPATGKQTGWLIAGLIANIFSSHEAES